MEPKETTDLAKTASAQIRPASPASPMAMAMELCKVNSDMTIEKMEKILQMQREFDADEARKEFILDFVVVQASVDVVINTKQNSQTNSKYSGLEDVLRAAKPIYTEHGFSVIFYEGIAVIAEDVRVCADVLHRAGHKETYHLDVPIGGVGIKGNVNMTKIHAKATSVTYGRRYLLCMIWNIQTQDTDGNPPPASKGPPEPSEAEQKALDAMCEAMVFFVPDDMTLDPERIRVVSHARAGHYPPAGKSADSCAKWLVDILNKGNSWATVCQKP